MKATPVVIQSRERSLRKGSLTFVDAMQSPCATCDTAPCCSHLPLPGFPVETLMQFDHARWLLGFEGIELGVSGSGEWSVFYREHCRFLDVTNYSCTIHGTSQQPSICQHYNPYTCWYRKALIPTVSADFLRIDRKRFEMLVPLVRFDDDRNVVAVPTWDALQELFAEVPVDDHVRVSNGLDPMVVEWQDIALGRKDDRRAAARSADRVLDSDPCAGCAAYCCETLQFFIEPPTSASSVDYLRFALGFKGVQLGIGDGGWSLLIRTRCRHLKDGRCSVYNTPERPLRCRYFDAYQCPYPTLLGTPKPSGFVRIGLESFATLESVLEVDEAGNVLELPSADTVRNAVENTWRMAEPAASVLSC
jgi:Fe-S-cluster containining protein